MALTPYLCVFLDGRELQVWMLDLLLHHSVQVGLHRYAVSLVQEVERGESVLQRERGREEMDTFGELNRNSLAG